MAADLTRMHMVIGGKAADAVSGQTFESENPYAGPGWAVVPDGGREDVDAAGGTQRRHTRSVHPGVTHASVLRSLRERARQRYRCGHGRW